MNRDCLSERDLILLHYGEPPERTTPAAASVHLAACPDCRGRQERLAADLGRIPGIDPDPAAATRIAARVTERLHHRRRRWLPVAGAAVAATAALVITLTLRSPQTGSEQIALPATPSLTTLILEEEMPDLDFLENLELIEDIELLQQIEGV
jgi:hypothetical protein